MADFTRSDADPKKFLDQPYARELLDDSFQQLQTYSDEELRQSIIQDILMATMWEIFFSGKLQFHFAELTRFINPASMQRVVDQLQHAEVQELIEVVDGQYRIRDNHDIRQQAMEYAGIYYTGYDMPEGCIIVDREAFEDALEEHGGLESLAKALAMELEADHGASSTLH